MPTLDKKFSSWDWVWVIPLIVLTSPIWLTIGLVGAIRNRNRGWFPPPDEGPDGVGVPAGLVPGPPSLACKHAEKWPIEFE